MPDKTENSFKPENQDIAPELEALRKLRAMSEEKRKALAGQLSSNEIQDLSDLVDNLKTQKSPGLKKEDKEKENQSADVPIQTITPNRERTDVGTARYTRETDRLILESLKVDCEISKQEIERIAEKFGVKEQLLKELNARNIWADMFSLSLNWQLTNQPKPLILGSSRRQDGTEYPIEFSDRLFTNWEYSGKANVKIDVSTRPIKIELII
ncbi:MAG TPA: hypothetical protein VF974_03550 [Patescibacteria group bacterium]